jgi:3-oxoacyl-[acyl-carrier-protein] synthase-3
MKQNGIEATSPTKSADTGWHSPVTVVAVAGATGLGVLTVAELARRFDLAPEKIAEKTGTTVLRRFESAESIVAVARDLALRLLDENQLRKADIRGVFGSSNPTTEYLLPTFTAAVAHAIGLSHVIVDHVGIGCCGGIQAMRNAHNQLVVDALEGRTSHCLVVAGDQTSRILDPQRKQTGTLFGEGVAVALMSNSSDIDRGYVVRAIGTKSLLGDALWCLRLRNPYAAGAGGVALPLEMDGARVFDFAVNAVEHFLALIDEPAVPSDCYLIPHQPNLRLLEAMIARGGLDPHRVYVDGFRTVGNTSGAAPLLGLEDAVSRGLVSPTAPILLGAFGAELQVGAAMLDPIASTRQRQPLRRV